VYSPGADQVAISTNGTGRLFIASDGRVSVGGSAIGSSVFTARAGTNQNITIKSSSSEVTFEAINDANNSNVPLRNIASQYVFNTGATERLRITSDGKLGLGTSSPGAKMDVWPASSEAALRGNSGVSVQVPAFELRGYNTNTTNGGLDIRTNLNSTFTDRVRITNDGLVGIGTTSPGKFLEIGTGGASENTDYMVRINRGVTGEYADLSADNGFATIDGTNGSGGGVRFLGDGNERARIDSSGRLLVGTSSPWDASADSILQLVATGASNPKILTFGRNTNSADAVLGNIEFYSSSNVAARISAANDLAHGAGDGPGRLVFSTNPGSPATTPTERLRINSSGQIAVAGAGSAAAPVITKGDDLNTGIFFPAADTIAFAEGGSEAARIDSSGRLLVGTSSASAPAGEGLLEVNGAIRAASISTVIELFSTSATTAVDLTYTLPAYRTALVTVSSSQSASVVQAPGAYLLSRGGTGAAVTTLAAHPNVTSLTLDGSTGQITLTPNTATFRSWSVAVLRLI
jgi:hypothetical protein